MSSPPPGIIHLSSRSVVSRIIQSDAEYVVVMRGEEALPLVRGLRRRNVALLAGGRGGGGGGGLVMGGAVVPAAEGRGGGVSGHTIYEGVGAVGVRED
jgi:hypothetical protein